MKLYEIARNTWVKPVKDANAPPEARSIPAGEAIKFHRIDGMYSYCHDKDGNVVHLPAWEEVEIVQETN